MSQPERIYGFRELTRILTLTPRRAGQLRRLELLRGDSGYTFRDLLALRAASALLDAGASVRQIRSTLSALRRQDPGLEHPLAELRLMLEGDRLLAQSDRVRFDPRTGQMVLALDSGGLEAAASATLSTGLVRPMAPPADQAVSNYRQALELSPDYADAHFNLAGALARSGRDGEAIKHWQRYLELDAGSPWARIARAHLEVVEPPEGGKEP